MVSPVAKRKRVSSALESSSTLSMVAPPTTAAAMPRTAKQLAVSAQVSLVAKASAKYIRGDQSLPIKSISDKKLKGKLRRNNKKFVDAAEKAVQSELLLTEDTGALEAEGMERTWKFRQSELKQHVDMNTSRKMFDLKLPEFGPYMLDYTSNGRHLLIGGRKGHVASFDWQSGKLACELQLRETANCLEFLPYHFLLVSSGNAGFLKYQDTSTGQLVAEHRTSLANVIQ
ncbi:hypothetical protein BASA81_014108 [Batrachochytrium salamandrivorans]|nr:hypothetical protein BASA81_014108 [Batrachochytrium salamandrivorans]